MASRAARANPKDDLCKKRLREASAALSASRRPRHVVAGRLRALAARKRRAGRPVRIRRAGQVRHMRLFPLAQLVAVLGRRGVDGVMHPAMPSRRDAACLGKAVVDHPAPLEMQRGIDLAAAAPVVAVALLVLADQLAEPIGPELGAEGLAIPPGEEFEQELFHAGCRLLILDPESPDATGAANCPVGPLWRSCWLHTRFGKVSAGNIGAAKPLTSITRMELQTCVNQPF